MELLKLSLFSLSMIGIFVVLPLVSIFHYDSWKRGYKKGQIDAINGKIKFKLIKYPDGSKIWQEIKLKELIK